jgi:hypothetical protein
MPKFFFDLVEMIDVKKGVSLPSERETRRYAVTFARELSETQSEFLGESWGAWSVQVCNGKFDRIMKMPFSDLPDSKS